MKIKVLSTDITTATQQLDQGLKTITFSGTGKVSVEFSWPMAGIANQWYPLKQFDSTVHPDWASTTEIGIQHSAPIVSYYDGKGFNRITVAHNCLVPTTKLSAGVREEDGTLRIKLEASVDVLTVRIDERLLPYERAIQGVSDWWDQGIDTYPNRSDQREALFSTWYAYHQDVSQEKLESLIPDLVKLGIHRLILDDGWQTDDNHRGYAYTGDWKIATKKFPNFSNFVKQLHENHIEVVVWFSVPYVGMASKRWTDVKNRLLYEIPQERCGVLDLRYQVAIDELLNQYMMFIDKYNIDGLKLDFIDAFKQIPNSPDYDIVTMSYRTVEDGLLALLHSLKSEVLKRNPNFFIEFRQSYIGPLMRQFSNAFRVGDCPYSAQTNHVEICDLRLLSNTTPVHSDMVMWNPKEKPEEVALQLQATLFGVLQFSVLPKNMTEGQSKVVQYYLSLIRRYQSVLQEGDFKPIHPELNYPMVTVTRGDTSVTQLIGGSYLVPVQTQHAVIVNSSYANSVRVKCEPDATYQVTVIDCQGQEIEHRRVLQMNEIVLPQVTGGVTIIDRL